MSNRLSKGVVRAGSFAADSTGGFSFDADRITRKVKVHAFTAPGSTAETDTAFDLPSIGLVHRVAVKLTAASSAAGTMSVGLLASESGGSATGFLSGVSTTSTGLKVGAATASSSGSPDYFWSANTIGSFLSTFNAGTTAASDFGVFAPKDHSLDSVTAKSLSYTINSTGTAVTGLIYVEYSEIA